MRILITNDDGIHAPGLNACETIARALSAEIWIVAPERDQELLRIDARHYGRGNPYYWIACGRGGIDGAAPGSDLAALNDKRIALTPLRLDLTDEPFLTRLAEVFD